MNSKSATVVRPGEGKPYWVITDILNILVDGDATGGRYAFAENISQPGGGPPPHLHRREDEMFHVLEGEFEFLLNDKTMRLRAGNSVFVPTGVMHTFRNVSEHVGRLLLATTPPR
jgi:uncharacterized cupin superfamily protein